MRSKVFEYDEDFRFNMETPDLSNLEKSSSEDEQQVSLDEMIAA